MPAITITDASRRAGVQRSTLYRKAKAGEISVTKSSDGKNRIEMSELLRVYPDAAQGNAPPVNGAQQRSKQQMQQGGNGAENNALRREITLLHEQLHKAEEREGRYLGIIDTQTRQIADMRPKNQRRGFWRWLTTSE